MSAPCWPSCGRGKSKSRQLVRQHELVKVAPGRRQVLDQMVAAWAKDAEEGKGSAMLAWRRGNVAALNVRARVAMAAAGRRSGRSCTWAGTSTRLATGWSPSPLGYGQLVTSQRGEVMAVDPESGTLTVSMGEGPPTPSARKVSVPTASLTATRRPSTAARGTARQGTPVC